MQWSKELNVGVAEIDAQHRGLVEALNRFVEACDEGRSDDQLVEMLGFLDDYVSEHFAVEERIQAESGFPNLEAHRELHRKFIHHLHELKRRFLHEGASPEIVAEINRMVADWLVKHIAGSDKEVARFLKSRGTGD